MKIICIIPARLESTRFPRKVLSVLGAKPLLQWVWEAAQRCEIFDDIAFAIDDHETARLIESFEGRYFMTSPECLSGTDRLVELIGKGEMEGDIYVNWQGDEPFIQVEMIQDLLQGIQKKKFDIWTLKKRVASEEEVENPNVVKVVTDKSGKALYFSRSPIPYFRDVYDFEETFYYKHIGIYAFTRAALKKIGRLSASDLELAEHLEQLRFLDNGLKIQAHETQFDTIGIDHPEDLLRAQEWVTTQVT